MTNELMQGLEKAADRRGFLGQAAAAAAALVAGVFGFSKKAEALVSYRCCTLCFSPSGCSSCACWWSWACCMTGGCPCYYCKECYSAGYSCNGSCTGVKCSSSSTICVCGFNAPSGSEIPIC